jgi:hypothetical protein
VLALNFGGTESLPPAGGRIPRYAGAPALRLGRLLALFRPRANTIYMQDSQEGQ